MNLLLDTHVALWAITDSPRLSRRARDYLLSPSAVIWVSAASVWEIAIKHALGRGDMPVSGPDALRYFQASGYRLLAVDAAHAAAVGSLPAHHNDPFDRLLVAQALHEPMHLLTHDPQLPPYGDLVVAV